MEKELMAMSFGYRERSWPFGSTKYTPGRSCFQAMWRVVLILRNGILGKHGTPI